VAYAAKDMDAMAALVTEEMARAYALFGSADDVLQQAGEWEGLAGELLLGGPWYRVDPGRMLENHAAILETFGAA
jgi:alkanesulfonate monooxygenase SsuD/methylene tetrahydromethanopterin reductase-like flavin-dependent oxidoreductase (luciferase family)